MKSKRNKTIGVSAEELKKFKHFLLLPQNFKTAFLTNKIFFGNALFEMKKLPRGFVDLIVTDPPYNNDKDFGAGKVKLPQEDFKRWCECWIRECSRILKPTGSIYLCIDWTNSGMIQELLAKYFIVRNRITWKRDKGRGAAKNWKNNMEDIWFATKSDDYTFNLDAVKVKKAVIAPYVDAAGQPKDWQIENGEKFRLTAPANIWTDLVVPFWSMPENTEHPTQKPEKLVERIILASSNKDDLVFDPFMGSGTTAVVAKKLQRNYLGFEIEKRYYILAEKRLKK
jgi:site-specific DNA-methyltransferase (adenine-specific)